MYVQFVCAKGTELEDFLIKYPVLPFICETWPSTCMLKQLFCIQLTLWTSVHKTEFTDTWNWKEILKYVLSIMSYVEWPYSVALSLKQSECRAVCGSFKNSILNSLFFTYLAEFLHQHPPPCLFSIAIDFSFLSSVLDFLKISLPLLALP